MTGTHLKHTKSYHFLKNKSAFNIIFIILFNKNWLLAIGYLSYLRNNFPKCYLLAKTDAFFPFFLECNNMPGCLKGIMVPGRTLCDVTNADIEWIAQA